MDSLEFEQLVSSALEDLPKFFEEKLENVEVVIEEWPNQYYSRGRLLLGLYQGVPKTRRSGGYTMVLPDKITVFKGPIELLARGNPETIKNIVIDTVQHEIAHHFGISDARLRQLKK
ncbi:MAG: metallopeptidase family protein [Candidatus Woykebacteria bacterium]